MFNPSAVVDLKHRAGNFSGKKIESHLHVGSASQMARILKLIYELLYPLQMVCIHVDYCPVFSQIIKVQKGATKEMWNFVIDT
ncbi:hypothetical protein [Porphyrobacter sp. ULC335]|uniref:hypothetical protein n=1 Tax=Porphyrobacter sp. ULC335 TaxID=2854260 RepID=UPI00222103E2|nr:hypothetical protein [Porphyrobacter sp. ULC335]UYV16625.1 hypothetical protein KVF90_04705 [Porphyrobacter sp. ULC335]